MKTKFRGLILICATGIALGASASAYAKVETTPAAATGTSVFAIKELSAAGQANKAPQFFAFGAEKPLVPMIPNTSGTEKVALNLGGFPGELTCANPWWRMGLIELAVCQPWR